MRTKTLNTIIEILNKHYKEDFNIEIDGDNTIDIFISSIDKKFMYELNSFLLKKEISVTVYPIKTEDSVTLKISISESN